MSITIVLPHLCRIRYVVHKRKLYQISVINIDVTVFDINDGPLLTVMRLMTKDSNTRYFYFFDENMTKQIEKTIRAAWTSSWFYFWPVIIGKLGACTNRRRVFITTITVLSSRLQINNRMKLKSHGKPHEKSKQENWFQYQDEKILFVTVRKIAYFECIRQVLLHSWHFEYMLILLFLVNYYILVIIFS